MGDRMSAESILILLHTEPDGSLNKAAREALEAARTLDRPFAAGLVGATTGAAADSIAGSGAQRFMAVEGEAFAQSRYSTDAAAAEALVRSSAASVVIAPHTSRWARALPGVAQRTGGRVDTHVNAVSESLEASRWFYRQRIEAVLSRQARPWFILMDSGCAAPFEGAPGSAALEQLTVEVTSALTRTVVTGKQAPKAGQRTIRADAELLFVAGAGWTKKQKDGQVHLQQAADLILGFVQGAQASLGSSKSLVDLSGEGQAVLPFLSHLNQVGQTGSTPRHPKGLATCCHGEEPHVVGWRFIKERRAINLDANCGWARGKADILYVADAFAVMERVNALLAERSLATSA